MEKTHETTSHEPLQSGQSLQPKHREDEGPQRRTPAHAGWIQALKARLIYGVFLTGYAVLLTTYISVYIWLATILWMQPCYHKEESQSSTNAASRENRLTTR